MPNSARIDIGTRATSRDPSLPYRTSYHDSKIQFIILASELSSRGIKSGDILTGITFQASSQPGRDLKNLRIRIKETTKTSLSTVETLGLLLVYYARTIPRTSLTVGSSYRHTFNNGGFYYLGQNLLIEVTKDDYSGSTSGGGMYVRNGAGSGRLIGGFSDSNHGSFPFRTMSFRPRSFIPDCLIHYNAPPIGPKGFTPSWESITAESTAVKASHFTELRTLINDYEVDAQGASTTKSTWAEEIIDGETIIKNEHYNELKSKITSLNPMPASKPFPKSWSDLSDGAGITKAQMDALRDNLTFAYQTCFKCDTCVSCNLACHSCETCNNTCDYCDGCNSSCNGCDYCDSGCYNCDACNYCDGCESCNAYCDFCYGCDTSCYTCDECDYDY